MFRAAAGEWDVKVFHSLEDVLHAWDSHPNDQKTAVLHVGFERRVARLFEDLAVQFPGRVLLTPGARGALPVSFVTSKTAVGMVNEEPVFLALEGWGYSQAEPAQGHAAPATPIGGWLGSFLREHPHEEAALASLGIVDEISYVELESALPRQLRMLLGMYRSAYLVGEAGMDPTALARAAPPWLSIRSVRDFDLSVRLDNVFRRQSIELVKDIGALTLSELLKLPNLGRTSIEQLVDILRAALCAGPPQNPTDDKQRDSGTLLDAVRASLATCSERERDILVRRMGLGRPPETLAEIGEDYHVTRERIRQIEAKVVDRLVRKEVWDDQLAARLHVLLAEREFPLPLFGAEALDPWFSGVAAHSDAMRYIISNMCNAAVSLVEVDGIEYLSFLDQETWHETVATARRLLASGVDRGWSEQDCQNHIKVLLPEEAREFAALLWETASKWCHFASDGDVRTLISYGRGVDQIVEAVLLESAVPLHYSDIAVQAAARAGRELDERRVHNAAAEVGYLFGSGTYGLLKHLSVPRSTWEALADEAAEIVTEAPIGRQWHASELIDLLAERGVAPPDGFDKYHLDIALKQIGQLQSLGRMVWARSDVVNEGARVEIRQAVISILQSAGGPITSAELRQRLVAVRGINQGMQFHVVDPVIKLNSQTWGLNDRDISIKRDEQSAFLDSVVNSLRLRTRPIHISECESLVGNLIPPRAMFCLAAQDTRLRVTQDRFLALSEW